MLIDLINKCFSEDGWLVVAKGYRYESAQHAYAINVAQWLVANGSASVGLLEGATGVGKSIAYLIPACLHIAQTGARGVVATHTLSLLDQIVNGSDLITANEYLLDSGYAPIKTTKLIGKHHYIDPVAFENHLMDVLAEGNNIVIANELISGAYSVDRRTGYLEDFIRDYGPLPECLDSKCFTLTGPIEDASSDAFLRDREAAKLADLVITSHTTLLLNRRHANTSIFESEKPLNFVICDEADLIPSAAESLTRKRIRPSAIYGSVEKLAKCMNRAELTLYRELRDQCGKLEAFLGKKPNHKPLVFFEIETVVSKNTCSSVVSIIGNLKKLNKSLSRRIPVTNNEDRQVIEQSLEIQRILDFYVSDEKYSMSGVAWTKAFGLPSLEIISPLPGNAMRRYYSANNENVCRTLFTSATLSNGRSKSFEQFRTEIGCRVDEVSIEAQHEPVSFGSCEYILTDLSIPKPVRYVSNKESTEFAEVWVKHVVDVISMASRRGNVLCLTVSFSEAIQIGSELDLDCPIHIHLPGQRLSDLLEQFKERGGILISPSAWEGVSIRDFDGDQHFTELVVSRAPYSPPEPFKEKALISYFQVKRKRSLAQAKGIAWSQGNINATRKLRQGFGRLIRNANDAGRIYVCDPRFPLSDVLAISRQDRGLTNAIPSRFWSSYCDAKVFGKKGEEQTELLPVEKYLSKEELEWI